MPITLINILWLSGYHTFHYQPTETLHGGAGFYVKDTLIFTERNDISLNSAGDFESCFIELVVPNTKMVSAENKICVILGDFNIDLLKVERNDDANDFYNNMTSYFFSPFILQTTRPTSKTLIDNIFINSLEYKSINGNLIILLSDHSFHFVILEGFFKEIPINESNRYERNFKNFNEREFQETLSGVNWDTILSLDNNDPNLSINNFYNHLNLLLDDFAPFIRNSRKRRLN